MEDPIVRFYDDLAGEYDLIFADWRASMRWQVEVLDRVIRDELGQGKLSLLDGACGIGTQAIGLAERRDIVHATGVSGAAVDRAGREAAALGVSLTTDIADLRSLAEGVPGRFDVALACDNALPHLRTDDDLQLAARNMLAKTRPGGLLLASIRDYDRLVAERPRSEAPRIFDGPQGRRIVFQVWDWAVDGRAYTFHLFIVREAGSDWLTWHRAAQYRAVLRHELSDIFRSAGGFEIRWLMPEESGYYQPLLLARNA